jgi:hypothetical protein
MNILFIGDIVGRTGRNAVKMVLPELKKEKKVDFVIANGENLAGGFGMTIDSYNEMIEAGIDYFTSGNHIWNKKDFLPYLDDENIKVIRPANYTNNTPGKGFVEILVNGKKIVLINLLGVAFMAEYIANPFIEIDNILSKLKASSSQLVIVDFHAETTSEKVCFGQYLDGKVSAVIGTHTHIPTADARVLPQGTAYITDVGMVGALNSSLGDVVAPIINHYKTGLPFRLEVAEGEAIFNAVFVDIDEKTGKAQDIELIQKNVL